MSIEKELSNLKGKERKLEKKISQTRLDLVKLNEEKQKYVEELESLEGKKSSLAQQLREGSRNKLEQIEKEIVLRQKELPQFEDELYKIKMEILQKNEDTKPYINTEVQRMVPEFLRYIDENIQDIGRNIKQTFAIRGVTNACTDRYCSCEEYTGDVAVYHEENKIVTSRNFNFKKEINEYYRDPYYDTLYISPTKWFRKYLEDFILVFQEQLSKQYCYSEVLTLTIEKSGFTLELV